VKFVEIWKFIEIKKLVVGQRKLVFVNFLISRLLSISICLLISQFRERSELISNEFQSAFSNIPVCGQYARCPLALTNKGGSI